MKLKCYIVFLSLALISTIHNELSMAECIQSNSFLRPLSFAHRIETSSEDTQNNQGIPVYRERNGITLVGFEGSRGKFMSASTDLESSIVINLPKQNMRINRLTLNDRGEKVDQYEYNVEIATNNRAMEKFRAMGLLDSRGTLPAQNVGYIEVKPDGSLVIIDFDEEYNTTYKRVIASDGNISSVSMLNEAKQAMIYLAAAAARGAPGISIHDYGALRTVTYMGEIILRGDFVARTPSRVTVCKGIIEGNKFIFYETNGKRISIDNIGTFETETGMQEIVPPLPAPVSGIGTLPRASRHNAFLFSQIWNKLCLTIRN